MVRNRGLPNVHPSMNEGRVEGPSDLQVCGARGERRRRRGRRQR